MMYNIIFNLLLLLQISTSIVYDNKVSRKFFLNGLSFSGITALNFNNPVNTNTQKYKFVSNERILYLYGDIDNESCNTLVSELESLSDDTDNPIHLRIQSYGGEIIPTLNVIDTITRIKNPVYTYVDGYAASAATLISVSGNYRCMGKHSLFLMHKLYGSSEGNYDSLRDEFDNDKLLMNFMEDIYLENSNLNKLELDNILNHPNKWMNSSNCLKYDLIDEIL